jgi:hypothetical protein
MQNTSFRWTRELTVFLVGLAVNIAIVLSVKHNFPFEDSVDHLTRYVLMGRAWTGHGAPYVQLRAIPGPYLGLDLIGAALSTVLSPEMTLRILSVMVVSAIPIGFYLLLRATGRANVGWALVGVILGFGFFAHVGFMNYTIGVGLALAWLAAWWPHRADAGPARIAALAVSLIAIYLFHLSSPLIVLVVIWVDMLLAWRVSPGDRRVRGVLAITLVLGLFVCLELFVTPHVATAGSGAISFGTVWSKLRNVFSPFYVYSYPQSLVGIVAYVAALVLFLRSDARPRWLGTWGVAGAAFLLLYLVFPANLPGTGYLDIRWLIPAFLAPFIAPEEDGTRVTAPVLGVLLVVSLLNSAVLSRSVHTIDRELDDYALALDRLPPGRAVFPIVADGMRWGPRVIPYRHFAFWYQIEDGGRVPSLFNYGGDGGRAPAQSFMPYFVETEHLYPPPPPWNGGLTNHPRPIDWSQVAEDYDYVIVAGPDPRVRREVSAHAREAYSVGEISVYSVPRATAPAPRTTAVKPPSRAG